MAGGRCALARTARQELGRALASKTLLLRTLGRRPSHMLVVGFPLRSTGSGLETKWKHGRASAVALLGILLHVSCKHRNGNRAVLSCS